MIAQTIDAAAREHQQAVLHDVHLHHGQSRAGLIGHRVHREIEGWIIGKERANLERVVAHHGVAATSLSRPVKQAGAETPGNG